MKKYGLVSLIGVLVVAAIIFLFVFDSPDNEKEQAKNDQDAIQVFEDSIEVIASDDGNINANKLFIPWTINKNAGTFYLSQRDGTIVSIDSDFGLVEVQNVEVSKDILHKGESGFLGFTLAPDFENSKQAFAFHTYDKEGEMVNRIVTLALDGSTWKEEDVILDNIPGGEMNNGGRIKIGPDGMLYATTGDLGQGAVAQDLDSLAGKILRMELNGEIPSDNPFEDSYVYSYGHRNSQGLVWDEQGVLYSSEHGEDGHDEINIIEAGKNYGWPIIEGDEEAEGMVSPLVHSGDDTWAPSGIAYHDGQLYISSLAGKRILTYDIATQVMEDFYDEAGRLRDVFIEEDALFVITSNRDNRGEPTDKDDRLIHLPLAEKTSN
ncbi:PQQ-dependent sugar dehydrogenase [Ornithinibacillus sp. BX22]|uniref:PQQ-dependent sugar dehydrogenase n=2 Tax=Ornithinibacillus TaxID=484508 RepID=A0A923L977_9BACI|nr:MULTISPECIES: PQQ-dependent sugar dehydrogenase [Ornithinibacillus]MBC5638672.1 PQQ-dependent sugar dehydrogenase [Ornithinibacillus hominis]MBS3680457.1 PQQ-dependent sugar dehydrogenase [Ornithinibacillus massiliensis]